MIDPKLDKIPVKPGVNAENENETSQAAGTPRRGLSINDTIASDANLSTGGRGVDVSGVRAGAGAGAGSAYVTPGHTGGSPAPNIAPGPSGSGMTPISDGAIEQSAPAEDADSDSTAARGSRAASGGLHHDEIAAHAYRCWHERGCPEGSPEVDWQRAETELSERGSPAPRAASANA